MISSYVLGSRGAAEGAALCIGGFASYIDKDAEKLVMSGKALNLTIIGRFILVVLSAAFMTSPATAEKVVPNSVGQVEYSFAPIISKVAPAVVNIYTKRVIRRAASPLVDDPFFRKFFGDRFSFGPQEREQNSLGSGVLVQADGIVVTNNHVVDGADQITVALSDRREFEAEVVLADSRTDLAVLKIDTGGEALPFLAFRDSDTVEVGDLVFAIGNPFGVGKTVTSGIVSAVARSEVGVSDFESFIQTDAAINPGNSGGALVGLDGRLFGINTVILSRSGGSNGVGFAIPANMVSYVVDSALKDGKVVRPWLGVSGQPVTNDIAQSVGLDRPGGVLINGLYEGGPAQNAGMMIGDIVVAALGRQVVDPKSLASRLGTQPVGGKAEVVVYRGGQKISLIVPLLAPPEVPPSNITTVGGGHIFAGATIANMSPALAEKLRVDAMKKGVIVLEVERGSVAERLRLRRGDIFVSVNGEAVKSVSELDVRWRDIPGQLTVQIRRGDRVLTARLRQ